jgi:hypothetical protein
MNKMTQFGTFHTSDFKKPKFETPYRIRVFYWLNIIGKKIGTFILFVLYGTVLLVSPGYPGYGFSCCLSIQEVPLLS